MKTIGEINRKTIENILKLEKSYYFCSDCKNLYSDKNYNIRLFSLKSIVGTPYFDSLKENYNINFGICIKCYNDKLEVEK